MTGITERKSAMEEQEGKRENKPVWHSRFWRTLISMTVSFWKAIWSQLRIPAMEWERTRGGENPEALIPKNLILHFKAETSPDRQKFSQFCCGFFFLVLQPWQRIYCSITLQVQFHSGLSQAEPGPPQSHRHFQPPLQHCGRAASPTNRGDLSSAHPWVLGQGTLLKLPHLLPVPRHPLNYAFVFLWKHLFAFPIVLTILFISIICTLPATTYFTIS